MVLTRLYRADDRRHFSERYDVSTASGFLQRLQAAELAGRLDYPGAASHCRARRFGRFNLGAVVR